jgi:hypothetical protein
MRTRAILQGEPKLELAASNSEKAKLLLFDLA